MRFAADSEGVQGLYDGRAADVRKSQGENNLKPLHISDQFQHTVKESWIWAFLSAQRGYFSASFGEART
ncbi:hypothetical protein DKM44_09050 [Deinococcus irradiatisoli]|uniref:Uncharacterized protein n=1 Tax=Deinococcus irradiatisoli TaxID=2202254 RepID=A0A2Z3JDW3_9DEIO|nr:hypothetical protein [Deinococcus irradiatisoli]AWN23357.1 hypothetical protein DKM44_09050 [Deinococcus irradiatisoli]